MAWLRRRTLVAVSGHRPVCGPKLKLPLADSIILATARQFNAVLWTQDADFEKLPGVR
jgi:predicted nucleic acid-binding protein